MFCLAREKADWKAAPSFWFKLLSKTSINWENSPTPVLAVPETPAISFISKPLILFFFKI